MQPEVEVDDGSEVTLQACGKGKAWIPEPVNPVQHYKEVIFMSWYVIYFEILNFHLHLTFCIVYIGT